MKKLIAYILSFPITLLAASLDGSLSFDCGNEFMHLQGFKAVHKMGITGRGTHIAILEQMRSLLAKSIPSTLEHKRRSGELMIKDCSASPYVLHGAEDVSSERYLESTWKFLSRYCPDDDFAYDLMEKADYRLHEVQTTALAFQVAPHALGIGVHVIHRVLSLYCGELNFLRWHEGAGVHTLMDFVTKAYEGDPLSKHRLEKHLKSIAEIEESDRLLKTKPTDSSLLEGICCASKRPKCVINASIDLLPLVDPFNDHLVPDSILAFIAEALESSDSLLILAATNLESPTKKKKVDGYLRSLAKHPSLSKRVLFVANAEVHTKQEEFLPRNSFQNKDIKPHLMRMPNGEERFIAPYGNIDSYTNTFEEDVIADCAVAALGSDIIFPDDVKVSGTSFAAPQVSGLIALMREKYPSLDGPSILQIIKNKAIKTPPIFGFGHGLINAIAACE